MFLICGAVPPDQQKVTRYQFNMIESKLTFPLVTCTYDKVHVKQALEAGCRAFSMPGMKEVVNAEVLLEVKP